MKYFSTFSGVEGFGMGIGEHGECVGFSEIDKYASQVLRYKFPNIKNHGDITKIDTAVLPDFDMLVGGSPCQDLSIAGKRQGLAGARSGLFLHFVRLLEEKQPRYFIWENVKGALSSNSGADFATVLLAFSEAGYHCTWQVLNAKHFGVPQNRERVFVVGTRGEPIGKVFSIEEGTGEHSLQANEQGCASTLTRRSAGGGNRRGNYIHQLNNPSHSNERVYGAGGVAPTLNTMQGGMRQPFIAIPEATKKGYAEAHVGDSINLAVPNSASPSSRVGNCVAQTLDTGMQQYTLTPDSRVRRLTPLECERLMGWSDNHTKFGVDEKGNVVEVSDSQRYKMCGNGVVSTVVRALYEHMLAV